MSRCGGGVPGGGEGLKDLGGMTRGLVTQCSAHLQSLGGSAASTVKYENPGARGRSVPPAPGRKLIAALTSSCVLKERNALATLLHGFLGCAGGHLKVKFRLHATNAKVCPT